MVAALASYLWVPSGRAPFKTFRAPISELRRGASSTTSEIVSRVREIMRSGPVRIRLGPLTARMPRINARARARVGPWRPGSGWSRQVRPRRQATTRAARAHPRLIKASACDVTGGATARKIETAIRWCTMAKPVERATRVKAPATRRPGRRARNSRRAGARPGTGRTRQAKIALTRAPTEASTGSGVRTTLAR